MSGKTSTEAKNRWNKKTYDRVLLVIPKGRKEVLEQRAKETGQSVNGYLNRLIQTDLGLSDEAWKRAEDDE